MPGLLPILRSPQFWGVRRYVLPSFKRFNSSIGKIDKPTYQLTFTCKKCDNRSSHLVSKQAYHNGTVLIQCPSCKNRHLIADNLKIFGDQKRSLEEILAASGEHLTKSDLGEVGDLEWEPQQNGETQGPKAHLIGSSTKTTNE